MQNEKEIAVSIPIENIEKILIVKNNKYYKNGSRRSLQALMNAYGADYAINGTLYNMNTMKAVCPMKYSGVIEYAGPYKYRGYAWDDVNFHLDIVPNNDFHSYIACSNILKDGKVIEKMIYNAAQGGRRGRAAIGTKTVNGKKRICLYASRDGSTARRTPEKLAELLKSYGWDDAVMLDCGGSSQACFKNEKRLVYSSRKVAHVILVFLKKGKK